MLGIRCAEAESRSGAGSHPLTQCDLRSSIQSAGGDHFGSLLASRRCCGALAVAVVAVPICVQQRLGPGCQSTAHRFRSTMKMDVASPAAAIFVPLQAAG